MSISLLLLGLLGSGCASLLSAPRVGSGSLRLRGGAEEANGADDRALSMDEITEKLNKVPTFVMMGEDGGFVALHLREGGRAICFFSEPEEAQAVLNMTREAHPDQAIKLVTIGLGNALKLCKDSEEDEGAKEAFSSFDGHLRVQGPNQIMSSVEPKLKSMLVTAGFEEGSWQFPVFMCEQLVGQEMLPVFLNPREIHAAWKLNNLDPEKLPDKFIMMDVRMMMADMQKEGSGMPWEKVAFIGAEGGAELANNLIAAATA